MVSCNPNVGGKVRYIHVYFLEPCLIGLVIAGCVVPKEFVRPFVFLMPSLLGLFQVPFSFLGLHR